MSNSHGLPPGEFNLPPGVSSRDIEGTNFRQPCSKCSGYGEVENRNFNVNDDADGIEQTEEEYIVCDRCNGTGIEE